MMSLVGQIKHSTQLRWSRVHKFKAKVKLKIDVGPYIIKTAETYPELLESFKLRDEVFNQEFRGIDQASLDFDKFDFHFDHLIIVHRESEKIIGTYRLSCSKFSKESYAALEFDLSMMRFHPGVHLELGRACIKKDYRKGSVISLLWRGIAEYMNLCEANILFGCSSLKINNPREAALVFRYLHQQDLVTDEFVCKPTKEYRMKEFDIWYSYFGKELTLAEKNEAGDLIPPLLFSYLKMGARIACEPAFDEEFDCIDMLTILRKEDLTHSLSERFKIA